LRYLLIETNWGNNRYQQHDAVFILISNKIDNKLIFSYVVPVMKQQRTGSIINIASIAAITGWNPKKYSRDFDLKFDLSALIISFQQLYSNNLQSSFRQPCKIHRRI
jgi:hypothetical protein